MFTISDNLSVAWESNPSWELPLLPLFTLRRPPSSLYTFKIKALYTATLTFKIFPLAFRHPDDPGLRY